MCCRWQVMLLFIMQFCIICIGKTALFEFYLIGFMLALATLPYLLGSMKDAPRGISIRQEDRPSR